MFTKYLVRIGGMHRKRASTGLAKIKEQIVTHRARYEMSPRCQRWMLSKPWFFSKKRWVGDFGVLLVGRRFFSDFDLTSTERVTELAAELSGGLTRVGKALPWAREVRVF